MRYLITFLLCVLLASCQSFTTDEENLALESELEAYATEAAELRNQIQADRTAIAETIVAGGTQVAAFTDYNARLAATVQSGIIPTATLANFDFDAQGPMPINMFDLSNGEMRFVQVGTAGQITPNDRCFVSHQNFFNEMSGIIYMTALALNLRAGTVVRVDWQYGSEVVYSNAWTAPQSLDGQCVALEFRPSNAPFLPGNWTATMYINGEPIDPAPFTISGS